MKNRNILLLTLVLGSLSFLYNACTNNTESNELREQVSHIPPMSAAGSEQPAKSNSKSELPRLPMTDMQGKLIMASDLKGKTVLVLFQPDCEDCQREAAQIQQQLDAFKDYSVYFVSNAELMEQARFADDYQLSGQSNVHFAQSSINDIISALGPTPAPSVFIYAADGRLVKSFKGETDIQQILPHL